MRPRSSPRDRYLVLAGALTLAIAAGLVALDRPDSVRAALFRGSAWLGYLAVFETIVSSAYVRRLSKFFGRSFLLVHHIASLTGLIMVTVHPLFLVLRTGTFGVFVPVVTSWERFFSEGGRPAWYLLGITSLAALLRRALGRSWRAVHLLTYLAFWLASAHIILRSEGVHALVAWTLALIVVAIVVRRYVWQPIAARRRRARDAVWSDETR